MPSRKAQLICSACVRKEEESLLGDITLAEHEALDMVAEIVDAVSVHHFKPGSQPAKVNDWLYLGDLNEALDVELLRSKGIDAVLNVMNQWQVYCTKPEYEYGLESFYLAHDLTYDMIEAKDDPGFDLVGTVWPQALQLLSRWQREGKTVLVNCKVGHNRSACLVACWLVTQDKLPLARALKHLLDVRGTILSNHSFRLQLVRLALSAEAADAVQDSEKALSWQGGSDDYNLCQL